MTIISCLIRRMLKSAYFSINREQLMSVINLWSSWNSWDHHQLFYQMDVGVGILHLNRKQLKMVISCFHNGCTMLLKTWQRWKNHTLAKPQATCPTLLGGNNLRILFIRIKFSKSKTILWDPGRKYRPALFTAAYSPLFQWVRLGLEARGLSAAAREAAALGPLATRLNLTHWNKGE